MGPFRIRLPNRSGERRQLDLDAAVLGAAFGRRVGCDGTSLAEAGDGEAALIDLTLVEQADPVATLHDLKHITDQLLVRNPSYRCSRCGFGARSHHWQCPSCKEWGTVKPLLNYAVV